MKKAPSSNRSFGWTFTAFFALSGAWSAWKNGTAFMILFALAAVTATISFFRPGALAPLNHAWMKFAELLNRLVSPIVLAVMFYGVFTPTGFLMQAFGKDPMKRKYDPAALSYWIDREPPGPAPESLHEQF